MSHSTYSHDHTQLRIHELFCCETVAHKHSCLWLWDSTQRLRSSTMVDLIVATLLYSQICCLHKVSNPSFKRVWKNSNSVHCPSLEYVKTCSRICIWKNSIKTLDPMAEKESENSDLHESQSVEMCILIGWDKWDCFCTYLFLLS